MSPQVPSLQETRMQLHAIATELVELCKTYEPTPSGTLSVEDPLIKKAKALIARAQTPSDFIVSATSTSMELIAIRTLLDFETFPNIPETGSIDLDDLAKKSNASPALLTRLLRIIVSSGFIIQNPNGSYSHSHLSIGFNSEANIAPRLLDLFYETGLTMLVRLPEYVAHRRTISGSKTYIEPSADALNSAKTNLFTWHHNVEDQKTSFEIMEENPTKMKKFQKIMSLSKDINPYTGFYDFSKLATTSSSSSSDAPVFIDIGGGHGDAIAAILSSHPEILPTQCILQDTSKVIEYAKSEANLPSGVQYLAHDFFTPQPIKGARAYHLRAIAHDLSDASLIRVLGHIRDAMDEDSRVLIADDILGEKEEEGLGAFKDLMMMVIGGKERTEREFRDVVAKAGLTVEGVYRAGGRTRAGIVEASLM